MRLPAFALTVLAVLATATQALAAPPTPGVSFWVRHNQFDRDNLINIDQSGKVFADSAVYTAPPPAVDFQTTARSFFQVDATCLNGARAYTWWDLNGVRIAPDGSFRADLVLGPSKQDPNPFQGRWRPARSEFHLRGVFTTPTTVKGTFWEIVYARRSARRPAFAGQASRAKAVTFCRTGTRARGFRVPFTGTVKPIQWISKNTAIDAV